jgi:hypothetical protein
MKKIYLTMLCLLSLAMMTFGQAWEVYDAKVLPDADPHGFVPSNTGGAAPMQTIMGNPGDPADSLLQFIVYPTDAKYMWRYNFQTDSLLTVTMVARVKGVSDSLDRVMEFDFDNGGLRERLFTGQFTRLAYLQDNEK